MLDSEIHIDDWQADRSTRAAPLYCAWPNRETEIVSTKLPVVGKLEGRPS
jgi:hypothetical protein